MADALPTVDELMELARQWAADVAYHGAPEAAHDVLRAALSRVLEATAVAQKEREQSVPKALYYEMLTNVIEATGVEVPVGGMTAVQAVRALREAKEAAIAERDVARRVAEGLRAGIREFVNSESRGEELRGRDTFPWEVPVVSVPKEGE